MEAKTRVLIVDDDLVDRMTLSRILKETDLDLEIEEAANGVQGLEAISQRQFHCIFMDYWLPKENGLEVLKKLRYNGTKIPVIMLTGHGDEEIAVELMKAGATDYLTKNKLTIDYLARTLRHTARISMAEIQAEAALEALRQSEARTRAIIENTPDAIIITDEEGNIESFNPAAAKIFGYDLEKIQSTNTKLMIFSPERNFPGQQYLIFYLCSKNANLMGSTTEGWGKRFNGTTFPMELCCSNTATIKTPNHNLTGCSQCHCNYRPGWHHSVG